MGTGTIPIGFSLSLIVWSTKSLVFFGIFNLTTLRDEGPPPGVVSFTVNFAVLFNILTSKPPPKTQAQNIP